MATDSQQLIFHMLGNKNKLDLTRQIPSKLPETTVIGEVGEAATGGGFWQQAMNDPEGDVPPDIEDEDEDDDDVPSSASSMRRSAKSTKSVKSRASSRASSHRSRESRVSRRSRRSRKSRRRSRDGFTTMAPDGHEEARNFYMNKIRDMHAASGQPFDERRYGEMHIRDLQFIYNRNKNDQNTKSTVRFMKDIIKLGLTGVEGANEYFGPFVNLRGWARHATRDMSRYDACLEKIYKRYWRRGSVNPFMDLGLLIVGSAVVYHFQGLGNRSTAAAAFDPFESAAAEAPAAVPPPTTAASRQRPSMRPPTGGGGPGGGSGSGGLDAAMFGGGGGGGASMLASMMPMLMAMNK